MEDSEDDELDEQSQIVAVLSELVRKLAQRQFFHEVEYQRQVRSGTRQKFSALSVARPKVLATSATKIGQIGKKQAAEEEPSARTHHVHRHWQFMVGFRGECPECCMQNDSQLANDMEMDARTAAAHPTLLIYLSISSRSRPSIH